MLRALISYPIFIWNSSIVTSFLLLSPSWFFRRIPSCSRFVAVHYSIVCRMIICAQILFLILFFFMIKTVLHMKSFVLQSLSIHVMVAMRNLPSFLSFVNKLFNNIISSRALILKITALNLSASFLFVICFFAF